MTTLHKRSEIARMIIDDLLMSPDAGAIAWVNDLLAGGYVSEDDAAARISEIEVSSTAPTIHAVIRAMVQFDVADQFVSPLYDYVIDKVA